MSGAKGGSGQQWRPSGNPWLIAVTVTLAAFMEVLDTTIVNVSLPHIAGSLASSYDDATWALTSYLVANGIVLTISGWLSTVLGRKRYFTICIIGFTVCSFLCGISSSLDELILFRLLQGFFGGGLQPNQQAIVVDTFPPERRGQAFALTTIATVVAPVLGPTLGGYITDTYSWPWIFFINIPVGIGTAIAVTALIGDPPWARKRGQNVDYIGLSLITLGLGCLQVMMDRGEDEDWLGSPFIRIMALGALIGIVGAIAWLMLARKPVVDVYVFADRNFAVGNVDDRCGRISALRDRRADPAIRTAGARVYGMAGRLDPVARWPRGDLADPHRRAAVESCAEPLHHHGRLRHDGVVILYSSRLVPDINFDTLMYMRAAQTAGLAFLFAPISTIAFSTLRREQSGDAAALNTMFRNVFGSIGISMGTAMVQQSTQARSSYLSAWMTPLYPPFTALRDEYERTLMSLGRAAGMAQQQATGEIYQVFHQQSEVLAYHDVYLLFAAAAFCVVPFGLLLRSQTGGAAAPHG